MLKCSQTRPAAVSCPGMFSPGEEDPTTGVNKGGSSVSGCSPAPGLEKMDLADCNGGIMRIPACAKS